MPSPPSLRLPDFVIVGAQKAGSTNLAASLAQHPDVYLPNDEVPYFEAPFFDRGDPRELARSIAPARADQLAGIKRPDYLARPECPGNITQTLPEVRVIVSLRDPVARTLSAYYWYVRAGMLPLSPADEGLRRLLDGEAFPHHPHAAEVLDYGRYATHLRRYREHLDDGQLHVTVYEAHRRSSSALAEVHRFLGVPVRAAVTDRGFNEGVYDPRRLSWLRLANGVRFDWDDEEAYRWMPRRRRRPLGFAVQAAIVGIDRALLRPLLGNERPPLAEDVLGRLQELYAPEVAALVREHDLDVSEWVLSVPR